ncbi:MAG: helix-turn-helix transcriptional regulator [Candidatus Lokiarchaeota archaeon]|nr:helix-turn-helix transcriptional regulator [Candidatus Lokiarchaeota archaeon]
MVTRIKELRDERNLKQQELANLVGVSRQTIYFLEKGSYNPSLTLSLKIAEIFNKTIEEIFYFEPIIKDVLGRKTLDELEDISEKLGVNTERLIMLKDLNDDQLLNNFNEKELFKIAQAIGESFDAIFTIE